MVEIDVPVGEGEIGAAVHQAALAFGLTIASDGKLTTCAGSRHWHLKRPNRTGTLEITHWPAQNRLWVSYHANRVGDGWVAEVAPEFAQRLAEELRTSRRAGE